MPILSARTFGICLVLISAIIFSTAGLFVKSVNADAWPIIFWRGLSAAVFTACYLIWRKRLPARPY